MPIDLPHVDPCKDFNRIGNVRYTLAEYPRQVRIESSSFCNSACVYCHFHGSFKEQTRK